eukprot:scaffold9748_cov93-Isochrysis_galbana.AAC.2
MGGGVHTRGRRRRETRGKAPVAPAAPSSAESTTPTAAPFAAPLAASPAAPTAAPATPASTPRLPPHTAAQHPRARLETASVASSHPSATTARAFTAPSRTHRHAA